MEITNHAMERRSRIPEKRKGAILRRIMQGNKCYESLKTGRLYVKYKASNKKEKIAVLAENILLTILNSDMFDIYTRVKYQIKEIAYTEQVKQRIKYGYILPDNNIEGSIKIKSANTIKTYTPRRPKGIGGVVLFTGNPLPPISENI